MSGSSNPIVSPAERRRFVRVRKNFPLTYEVVDSSNRGSFIASSDLSVGGLQFAANDAVTPGTELVLKVAVGSDKVILKLPVRVVWCRYSGTLESHEVGATFTGLDDFQRENILALIATELPCPDGSENRRFIRLRHDIDIHYCELDNGEDFWHKAATHDLSLGGFAIECVDGLEPGAAVGVRIFVNNTQESPLEAEGEVVMCRPSGEKGKLRMSGKFRNMTPDTFDKLATFISERVMGPVIGPF
jgi:c-di-GMP-binding flagellar brake protein YcgR